MDNFPWVPIPLLDGETVNGSKNVHPQVILDPHEHCAGCFRSECAVGTGTRAFPLGPGVCPVLPCPKCFIQFHQCKLEEHLGNLCSEVTVRIYKEIISWGYSGMCHFKIPL